MTDFLGRTPGRRWASKAMRLAVWAGLAVSGLYPGAAAMAAPVAPGPASFGRLELAGLEAARLEAADPEKSEFFAKPTAGNVGDELACLALNIYFEARGEPDDGKRAVAHVVMNRVASGRFPETICGVVRQGGELRRYRCQFSWWCDGRSDKPRNRRDWRISKEIALVVFWGRTQDPTSGALWYHADYVRPYWRSEFEKGPQIGRHIFYRQRAARNRRVLTN